MPAKCVQNLLGHDVGLVGSEFASSVMLDSAGMVLCRSFIVSSQIRVDSVKTV